jgi:hypothetical protein
VEKFDKILEDLSGLEHKFTEKEKELEEAV